jgi:hypothetical protein
MTTLDNAHALVVGIANYQHFPVLPPTVLKDAADIAAVLKDPALCAYPPDQVTLLSDGAATRAAIMAALADLATKSNQDSIVTIYLSCHGGRIDAGPHAGAYILAVDTVYTSEQLPQTGISGDEFTQALQKIPARKMAVFFDCCHAGGIGDPKDPDAPSLTAGLPESLYATLGSGRGRVIVASSRVDEKSYVLTDAPNSLFTTHLLAGLRGSAPGPGGVIRIFDLFTYLQPKVTADWPAQHPIFKCDLEESFPVALYLGGTVPSLAPGAAPADGFAYDVFLSYRQQDPDKTWVRKTLLPALQNAGIRVCIDYRDFRLGAPLVLEMARAVEQSRYTLSILSPAYLTSNFTELENVLAEHLGLEKSQRRMLIVLRQECTPRLGMRARLMLDMTDDDEFATDLARLVYTLRQAPDA